MQTKERVGIVGLGQIGGGLADILADTDVALTLCVRRPEAGEAFTAALRKRLEKKARRRHLTAAAVEERLRKVAVTRELSRLAEAEVVVEAISEDLTAKRGVLAELSRWCAPEAIIASTTSELAPEALAEGLPAAQRIIGTHFLSPLRLTTAVEILPGAQTAPWVVTETVEWCRSLGKRPFVFPRSAINRLLGGYIAEGLSLCVGGNVDPEELDARMLASGMFSGPLSTLDLIGLDVAMDVFGRQRSALVVGDGPALGILTTLRDEGHLGKKSGSGIFLYADKGRGQNPRLVALLEEARAAATARTGGDIVERMWLRLINEYLLCIAQGIGGRDDIDAVLREVIGVDDGPLRRICEAEPAALLAQLQELEDSLGSRYEPSLALIESVRTTHE
jgi:3-hydroxyacyl-CoA dehydrogenase